MSTLPDVMAKIWQESVKLQRQVTEKRRAPCAISYSKTEGPAAHESDCCRELETLAAFMLSPESGRLLLHDSYSVVQSSILSSKKGDLQRSKARLRHS